MRRFCLDKKEFTVFDGVYPPREDSRLLAESVSIRPGSIVLDLGCGCGIQGISAVKKGAAKALAADKSLEALRCTEFNAKNFGMGKKIETRESDLFENIPEKFDCIIFNPPYVPTERIKSMDTDGGKNGRKTLDRFLRQFPGHLRGQGKCFFLQSSLNGEEKSSKILREKGLAFEVVARKRLFFEELIVFKCFKQ